MANSAPYIVSKTASVNTNGSISAASFISYVWDPDNDQIKQYAFWDGGSGGGYFALNGVRQAAGQWIYVNATDLGKLSYYGGSTAGSEMVYVAAFDGKAWSSYSGSTATTVSSNNAPVITARSASAYINSGISASSFISSVADADGDVIKQYAFWDGGSGGGYFSLNGIKQAAGQWIIVNASDLSKLTYIGGSSAGSEMVYVEAFDGKAWSSYSSAVATTLPANHVPVITAKAASVGANSSIAASSFIASVTDSDGDAIQKYGFYDTGSGGGYFMLNGVKQAAGQWIVINASDLAKLVYVGGTGIGSESIYVQAYDGKGWSSYSTATATTTSAGPWAQLADAGIRADVTSLVKSGALDYNGLLKIMQDAAVGGITASEYATLQVFDSLLNSSGGISVSQYLDDISNHLIRGDAANTYWTGGTSTHSSLGNMTGGTTQSQATQLIGKWLLGTDLPTARGYSYTKSTAPLFSSTGKLDYLNEVQQGYLGDCYLISSIAEVAYRDPNTIKSMFTDNGNGTYGVRFFVNGSARYVTVDSSLSYSNFVHGGNVKWAGLIEKAYVQLNSSGVLGRSSSTNDYLAIEGGWADPLTTITGKSVTSYYSTSYGSASSWDAAARTSIVNALAAGQEVLLATGGTTIGNLVGSHMFEVLSYNSAAGTFTVHNPWSSAATLGGYQMTFNVSMADIFNDRASMFTANGTARA